MKFYIIIVSLKKKQIHILIIIIKYSVTILLQVIFLKVRIKHIIFFLFTIFRTYIFIWVTAIISVARLYSFIDSESLTCLMQT